jgi:hypothetical protein
MTVTGYCVACGNAAADIAAIAATAKNSKQNVFMVRSLRDVSSGRLDARKYTVTRIAKEYLLEGLVIGSRFSVRIVTFCRERSLQPLVT